MSLVMREEHMQLIELFGSCDLSRPVKRKTRISLQQHLAYNLARTMVGTKEISDPGIHNDQILRFHRATTLAATTDEVPHCSAAMNYWWIVSALLLNPKEAQLLLSRHFSNSEVLEFYQQGLALVSPYAEKKPSYLTNYSHPGGGISTRIPIVMPTMSAMARSFCVFGVEANGEEADVVVYSRGSNRVSGHVGFLAQDKGTVNNLTLGSNQNNKVGHDNYLRVRTLNYRKVV